MITHVLFDMDGLLLDTECIYTRVTQTIVGRYGKVFDWSIKSNMIGRPSIDSARYLVDVLALPLSAEAYLEERDGLLRQAFPFCESQPGARRLVEHLNNQGIPIAVATSSSQDHYEVKTTNHEWFSNFDSVTTADSPGVRHGKPAPDIFLHAANTIGGQPGATLVFEDAPSGLEAATAAGMRTIIIPDPNMDKSRYDGAALILDSLTEFQPEQFGLPPFSK